MTVGQITLLGTSLVMAAVTYLFAPLLPPERQSELPPAFDYKAYREEALKVAMKSDDPASAQVAINHVIDSMEIVIRNAYSLRDKAVQVNRDSTWVRAARQFYTIYGNGPTVGVNFDQSLYVNVIYCYEKALKVNTESDSIKIALAVTYMENKASAAQVMKGVRILKQITDKDPGNITANLILGKYGIVSGQFDKAVLRFEKVLSVDSLNVEAYLYLGQAYEGKGEKEKAIQMLEKCRSLSTDPEFTKSITEHIEELKNS